MRSAMLRLKALGFWTSVKKDGADRTWLHYQREGENNRVRVYRMQVFEREILEIEQRTSCSI
jgi:hypothetical protein